MKVKYLTGFVALLSISASPTFAATKTGWISYISEDGHQLMLNSTDMYTIGPNVNLSSVAIGDQVKLIWEGRRTEKIVSNITKVPFDPTSS